MEFVDTVVTGRLGLSAPGFRRKHIRQRRTPRADTHTVYVLPVACVSSWMLIVYSAHDRWIQVFIFAFQGRICVVFIYLKTDLHLRLCYFIESNPVLSPRTKSKLPRDLYWIFASTEVSLCLGNNLARQYMSMLHFAANVETTGSDRHYLIPHCLISFLHMTCAYEIVWIYSSNTVLNICIIIAFKYFSMSFCMLSYCSGKLLQKLWWIWW